MTVYFVAQYLRLPDTEIRSPRKAYICVGSALGARSNLHQFQFEDIELRYSADRRSHCYHVTGNPMKQQGPRNTDRTWQIISGTLEIKTLDNYIAAFPPELQTGMYSQQPQYSLSVTIYMSRLIFSKVYDTLR